MTETNKTYVADVASERFAAVERHARKLRSEAFRDAGRAVAAWFKGLTSGSSASQGGRTA